MIPWPRWEIVPRLYHLTLHYLQYMQLSTIMQAAPITRV